jgi:peptide/nickel transport system substrate-binding protein
VGVGRSNRVGRMTRLAMAAFAAAVVLSLAACGSSSSGGEQALHAAYNSPPDYLDPALSFTLEGWTAMYESYIPLLTFAHRNGAAGTTVVPGLAKALPQISGDGKTYTLYLRPGLRYSNGQPVRASDFEWALQRTLLLNSAGSSFYTEILGVDRMVEQHRGGITGIDTDDATGKIVIHLKKRRATFSDELALLFAAPVPTGTPIADLTEHPPPATGPYEIVESHPGRGWRYVRNPEWSAHNAAKLPQVPDGSVAAIDVSVVRNTSSEVSDVERGQFDWMQNPPPPDRLPALKQKYTGTQLRIFHQPSVFYFWMNTRQPPFDDVRVRRAVDYAVDPRALERIYAGTLSATQQVLPPELPGYQHFELYPHNLAKARRLIAEANPRDRSVTVWTDNAHPNDEAGEYYEGVLREIGLKPKLKVVNAANYFALIGNASTPELDTGWANWLEDYPHPLDYFRPQLSSAGIASVGATNWARFARPRFDAEIERLAGQQLGPRQEAAYARLDREIMKQAPWAPFGNLSLATFVSPAVELDKLVINPVYGVDLATLDLR